MKIKRITGSEPAIKQYLKRHQSDLALYQERVEEIARMVKERGDEAVFELTRQFDGAAIDAVNFRVSEAEIEEAYDLVEDEYVFALRHAIDNIGFFHSKQMRNSWMDTDAQGNIRGQIFRPLERVGIYVPGGTAAYPSSVLMNAIPAQVAGVEAIAMVTPPDADGKLNPHTLVAAAELGIDEIYKVGGAQAIFALAWGGPDREPVDLISGPGNIYVTLAKKMVYGDVNIDMLAGPSEILIIADKTANPAWIAADMMSQAEHDVLARSILICDDPKLPDKVEAELKQQLAGLSRKDIIAQALEQYGAFIVADSMIEVCRLANIIAPEHLELMVDNPFALISRIKNAGAIFLGHHTPEPVGDYYAGPNHILPTGGTARFYSPVTVDTFMKTSNLTYYTPEGLHQDADDIIRLAEVEGLTAHAHSVRVRQK